MRDVRSIATMELIITDDMKLSDFSDRFHALFPFLKVEIIMLCGKYASGSEKGVIKYLNRNFGDCRMKGMDEIIHLDKNTSVQQLEEKLRRIYGLTVQVLRKSGKSWLETRLTSGWTLGEQNFQGESLSKSA